MRSLRSLLGLAAVFFLPLLAGCSGHPPNSRTVPYVEYGASVVCEPDLVTGLRSRQPGLLVLEVTDISGYEIPGATIRLIGEAASRPFISDASGRVRTSQLTAGRYSVEVEIPGFVRAEVENVIVRRGCTTALLIPLQLVDVVD